MPLALCHQSMHLTLSTHLHYDEFTTILVSGSGELDAPKAKHSIPPQPHSASMKRSVPRQHKSIIVQNVELKKEITLKDRFEDECAREAALDREKKLRKFVSVGTVSYKNSTSYSILDLSCATSASRSEPDIPFSVKNSDRTFPALFPSALAVASESYADAEKANNALVLDRLLEHSPTLEKDEAANTEPTLNLAMKIIEKAVEAKKASMSRNVQAMKISNTRPFERKEKNPYSFERIQSGSYTFTPIGETGPCISKLSSKLAQAIFTTIIRIRASGRIKKLKAGGMDILI